MTIIAVLLDPDTDRLILGSNSRSLVGDTVMPADRSKWLRFGDWALSFTGSGLLNDAILAADDPFPDGDASVPEVIERLVEAFEARKIGKEDDQGTQFDTAGLLVHRSGRVFDLDDRLSAEEINRGAFWASGSGMEYALGAAHALAGSGLSTADLVSQCVKAAIALDSGCPGDPIVEEF